MKGNLLKQVLVGAFFWVCAVPTAYSHSHHHSDDDEWSVGELSEADEASCSSEDSEDHSSYYSQAYPRGDYTFAWDEDRHDTSRKKFDRVAEGLRNLEEQGYRTILEFPPSHSGDDYPNGDFYLLWGNLELKWKFGDLQAFGDTLSDLNEMGFRIIVNLRASDIDVREAVTNPRTAGLIWISHGDEDGVVWGDDQNEIHTTSFYKGSTHSLKYVVLNNCHSEVSKHHYDFRKGTQIHHWHGKTNRNELFAYFDGEEWKDDIYEALGVQVD